MRRGRPVRRPWRAQLRVCAPLRAGVRLQDQHNNIAKFLEAKGMPEQALEVATDAGAWHGLLQSCCRPSKLLPAWVPA